MQDPETRLLRDIIEAIPYPLYVIDVLDHSIKLVNKAAAAIIGDWTERTCYAATHKRDRPCSGAGHTCPLEEVMRTKTPSVMEHVHYDQDGNKVYLEVRGFPIFDEKGDVVLMVESSVDITETRRAEEGRDVIGRLLRLSLEDMPLEEFLGMAIDSIIATSWFALEPKGAIFLVDDKDPRTLVMKAHRELALPLMDICAEVPFGRCLCGRAALSKDIVYKGSLDEHHENLYHGIGGHGHYCVPIIQRDEVLGVLNLYLAEGHVYDQKEADFLKVVADLLAGIIQRQRTLIAMEENEERFRSLAESAADAIIFIDKEGMITYWNRASEVIFGYDAGDTMGRPVTMLMPEGYRDAHTMALKRIVATGKATIMGERKEVVGLRKDGEEFPLEISLARWKTDEGPFFSAICHDITDRSMLVEELRNYTRELEESNRMKLLFTDIISHDLLNPIGAASTLTRLRLREETDPRAKEDLEIIIQSLSNAIDLIETAKVRVKLEGKLMLELEPMDLGKVIEDVCKEMAPLIKAAGMKVENKIDRDLPIRGSKVISHVFSNLISNAIKYASEGGRIVIEAETVEDAWQIRVTDFGQGIDDEFKEKVFNRLFTTDKKGVSGSGLGLGIVKKVVELHGGKVWVEDNTIEYTDDEGLTQTKKQGSIFYVRLPKERPE